MRVLIDFTQVTKKKAGVGIYALNTFSKVVSLDFSSRYFFLVQDDDPSFDFTECTNVHVLRVPGWLFRKLPFRFLLEQVGIPLLALWRRVDVVHSLHYSFPLLAMKAKKVVTIHDLTMLLMPEVHLRSKRKYFGFFLRAARTRADSLVFVSQSTRRDYCALFPNARGLDCVTELGKNPTFKPDCDEFLLSEVAARYGILKPYLLYLGTLEPRKNLVRLLESFQKVVRKHPEYQLVLAGKLGWMSDDLAQKVSQLGLQKSVVFTGFIPEEEKPCLVAGCRVFTYPSLYEGFGIPLLEAMACGVPTLSSQTSSLIEVAGDGALLVDPTSIDELSEGMERLICDEQLRETLRLNGQRQAKCFTWEKTAGKTVAAYRAVLKGEATPTSEEVHRA